MSFGGTYQATDKIKISGGATFIPKVPDIPARQQVYAGTSRANDETRFQTGVRVKVLDL